MVFGEEYEKTQRPSQHLTLLRIAHGKYGTLQDNMGISYGWWYRFNMTEPSLFACGKLTNWEKSRNVQGRVSSMNPVSLLKRFCDSS